jgi:hypothetical protein
MELVFIRSSAPDENFQFFGSSSGILSITPLIRQVDYFFFTALLLHGRAVKNRIFFILLTLHDVKFRFPGAVKL